MLLIITCYNYKTVQWLTILNELNEWLRTRDGVRETLKRVILWELVSIGTCKRKLYPYEE